MPEKEPPPSSDLGAESPEELQQLVRTYRVCFELWPLRQQQAGKMVQVGFELSLLGTPPGDRNSLMPGEDRGYALFQVLGRIAHWATVEAPPSVDYEYRLFNGEIHYSQRRKNRPDITLTLEIVHKDDYAEALDASEVDCLHGVVAALRSVGVQENSWK